MRSLGYGDTVTAPDGDVYTVIRNDRPHYLFYRGCLPEGHRGSPAVFALSGTESDKYRSNWVNKETVEKFSHVYVCYYEDECGMSVEAERAALERFVTFLNENFDWR